MITLFRRAGNDLSLMVKARGGLGSEGCGLDLEQLLFQGNGVGPIHDIAVVM